jgi:uncharacterized coiled-coil DUF342 family protein
MASLFLGAAAGPLADAIKKNETIAARLTSAYGRYGREIDRMAQMLEDLSPRTKKFKDLTQTHRALQDIHTRILEVRSNKEDANRVYAFLKTSLQGLSAGAREMKSGGQTGDRALRHDVLTLFKEIGKHSGQFIVDTYVLGRADAALAVGKLGEGLTLRYGHFAVDYAYDVGRLITINNNVTAVLTNIDDLNKARAHLSKQIVDSTDRINRLNAEIRQWQQPAAQTPAEMQKLLENRWVFDESF